MKRYFLLVLLLASANFAHADTVPVTVDIYPTNDGSVVLGDTDRQTNWLSARNFIGKLTHAPIQNAVWTVARSDSNSGWYRIYRGTLLFDTGSVPDSAVIKNASLHLNIVVGRNNDGDTPVVLTEHTRASSTGVTQGDWYISTYGPELARGVLNSSGYTTFVLNATGTAYINKQGYTDIGDLTSYDYDNIDPGSAQHDAAFWSLMSATDTRPYLEVTYTLPDTQSASSLIDTLLSYVSPSSTLPHQIKNSYAAQIERLQQFYDNSLFPAFFNQLDVLVKKVTTNISLGQVTSATGTAIIGTANDLHDLVASTTATTTAVRPVPLMTQIASPYPPESATWANDVYGDGTPDWCGNTIGGCGCAITSMAMLGRSYGINTGFDGTSVDPGHLNAWLQANHGYTALNTVRWYYSLQYLSHQLGYSTIQLDKLGASGVDTTKIDQYLSKQEPVIAFKKRLGHYFVLTKALGGGNYDIRDPFWYNTQTLNDLKGAANHVQNYDGSVDKVSFYGHSAAAKPFPRWVEIQLGSPAELLLTDGQGRKTGYDPATGQVVEEIPGSSYVQASGIVTGATSTNEENLSPKVLTVTAPPDDVYTLSVIGTGAGPYHLSVDTGGGYADSDIEYTVGSTTPGQVNTYTIAVPVLTSNARAIARLYTLAAEKQATQPTVATQLESIANRLELHNYATTSATAATALAQP